MRVSDLIQICKDEGREPEDAYLVIRIGDNLFDLETTDSQDPFNEHHFQMGVVPHEDEELTRGGQ